MTSRRARRGVATTFAAALAALSARAAHAADPFPTPTTAGQLACDMAPSRNANSAAWWTKVVTNTTYQGWFWDTIVPTAASDASCPGAGAEVQTKFWTNAVPENWNSIPNIGGWPWASGGYYTQQFWLHAVPDNRGPAVGKLATGFYDPQTGNENYYRYHFFKEAVPDNWAWVADIGGYPWPGGGGYYTQWFWLHAVPDNWAAGPRAIGGVGNKGFYTAWFYHFATLQDFAWDPARVLGATAGSGYYDYWWYTSPLGAMPFYSSLRATAGDASAGGYLAKASTGKPVNQWFDCGAQAVVILTFDTEGTEDQSCNLATLLNSAGATATFFLRGDMAAAIGASQRWKGCLAPFDFGNHTYQHPGTWTLDLANATQSIGGSNIFFLFDTFSASAQLAEINTADAAIRGTFNTSPVSSFRTPWCDGHKSFDSGVLSALTQTSRTPGGPQVIKADSSVAYLSQAAINGGYKPQKGLSMFAVGAATPFPFDVTVNGKTITEFPFAYPSDWAGHAPEMHNKTWAEVESNWEQTFDEIYSKKGVMTLLMHPFVIGGTQEGLDALSTLIQHMKAKANVRFSTMDYALGRSHVLLACPP